MSSFPKSNNSQNGLEAGAESPNLTIFHVMFQMQEPTEQPWGDAFRGRHTLPAITEIVLGFKKNGVRLRVFFLEDNIGEADHRAIADAFAALGRDHRDCWLPAFTICPMMFAASQGLDRSVGELMDAEHFQCQPDQLVNGSLSAMGYALMAGWRPDIAVQLLVSLPTTDTIKAALRLLDLHRAQHPDDPDLHQRECRDAVISILKSEIENMPQVK